MSSNYSDITANLSKLPTKAQSISKEGHVQLDDEKRNMLLVELEDVLCKESSNFTGDLSVLISCQETDFPVTFRISKLNVRFFKLKSSPMEEKVDQLQATYLKLSKEIESAREVLLSNRNAQSDEISQIKLMYDNYHHRLIDSVEGSLRTIEKQLEKDYHKKANNVIRSTAFLHDFESKAYYGNKGHIQIENRYPSTEPESLIIRQTESSSRIAHREKRTVKTKRTAYKAQIWTPLSTMHHDNSLIREFQFSRLGI